MKPEAGHGAGTRHLAGRAAARRDTPRRWRRGVAGAALVGGLAFAGLVVFLDRYGQVERARPADAIVVLGAAVTPYGVPSDSLRQRTLQAVALYRRGLAPRIICSGGLGRYPPSEAQAAAALAMNHGVPAADLLLEDRSTSTAENAAFTARLCRERGWTRVIVVSDPYHMWRARRNFERAGLRAYPSPALAASLNRSPSGRFMMTCREGLAVLWDGVRGR